MKAITLYQPWATWCVLGWKTVETRGHDKFKGLVGQRIAIHAGQTYDSLAIKEASPFMPALVGARMRSIRYPKGAIVGFAIVARARWLTPNAGSLALCRTDSSRFGLFLENATAIANPIPCSGHQGIWEVPAEILAKMGIPQ